MKRIIFSILLLLLFSSTSVADELRPAYLELKEIKSNLYSVLFKEPIHSNTKERISPQFPQSCQKTSKVNLDLLNKTYLSRWNIKCEDGLVSKEISFRGLKETNTDILLHLEFMNGVSQTILMSSSKPSYEVPAESSSLQVIATYTVLGVEHILEGFDHLLFVFALLLIVKNVRQLIWTITAFTLAHSITLAGATFGYLHLPQQPVEAIIALSILFLAMEVIHQKRGIDGIASRFPWIVAFTFGLLHGFGFAGALAEVGLPQQSVPLALLFFNVGVEIGQLIFVSGVLLIGYTLKKLNQILLLEMGELVAVYIIGSLSSFWLIERIIAFTI